MKKRPSALALFGLAMFGLSGCSQPKPAFDVPLLIGLDFKGVAAKLGTPETALVPDLTNPSLASAARNGVLKTWDVTWKRENVSLMVEYDLHTLKVLNLFIPTNEADGATGNLNRLRVMGNLVDAPTGYALVPVPAMGHPGEFTGLKIVPG